MTKDTPRWTEVEHLTAWDEEYYDVYTAKKFGKWVMMKTLKPQFRDKPEMEEMLNKEFDARYNLAHPNIVMINDLEEVPEVGLCIITDDVYGDTLRKLLDENALTDHHYSQLCTRLPMALEYIQQNHLAHHPLSVDNIIFTQNIGNLKLIDVGFDQRKSLSHADTNSDVADYGRLMEEVLKRTGRKDAHMASVAHKAASGGYRDVQAMQMAIGGQSARKLIAVCTGIIIALALVLAWMIFFGLERP